MNAKDVKSLYDTHTQRGSLPMTLQRFAAAIDTLLGVSHRFDAGQVLAGGSLRVISCGLTDYGAEYYIIENIKKERFAIGETELLTILNIK
jgi:hypothetical protein